MGPSNLDIGMGHPWFPKGESFWKPYSEINENQSFGLVFPYTNPPNDTTMTRGININNYQLWSYEAIWPLWTRNHKDFLLSTAVSQGMQLVSSGYNPVLMQKGMKACEACEARIPNRSGMLFVCVYLCIYMRAYTWCIDRVVYLDVSYSMCISYI